MSSRGDLTIKRGDTFRRTLQVTNVDDEIENITGATLTFIVRASPAATVNTLTQELTITNAAQGLAVLVIPASTVDSNLTAGRFYVYEVEMLLSGEVSTVIEGRVYVEPDRG